MRAGILYALSAYALWGLIPLYFKALGPVSAFEILAHRVFWSAALMVLIVSLRRQWGWLAQARTRPVFLRFVASAALVSVNWFVYIWGVKAGRVIDVSLGYFVNPLFSVVIGVALLNEKLRRLQWLALLVAAAGVVWLTVLAGQLPWIALLLTLSFGLYGFLRKTAALGSMEGLTLETLLLLPAAAGYLAWLVVFERSAFVQGELQLTTLLVLAGPVTAVPLLLFAAGARRVPLSMMGFLQYLGPTLQLLLGVFLYDESFGALKLTGFALIWLALAIYTAEAVWYGRSSKNLGKEPANAAGASSS